MTEDGRQKAENGSKGNALEVISIVVKDRFRRNDKVRYSAINK